MTSPADVRSAASALRAIASAFDARAEVVAAARDEATTHLDALVTAARAPDARHLTARGTATLAHARTAPDALTDAAGSLRAGASEADTLAAQLEGALRRAAMARTDLWRAAEAGGDPTDADRRLRTAEAEATGVRETWLRRCAALATTLASADAELGRIAGRLTLDHLRAGVVRWVPRGVRATVDADALLGLGQVISVSGRDTWHGARLHRASRTLARLRHGSTITPEQVGRTHMGRGLPPVAWNRMAADQQARANARLPEAAQRVERVRADRATNRPLTRVGRSVSRLANHPVTTTISRRVIGPLGFGLAIRDTGKAIQERDGVAVAENVLLAGGTMLAVFPPTAVAGAVTVGVVTAWQHRESIGNGARKVAGTVRRGIRKLFG